MRVTKICLTGCALVAAIVLATAPVAQAGLLPISYYNFNETSGSTAFDSPPATPGGRNGTLGTAVTRLPGTIGGGAVQIDPAGGAYTCVDTGALNSTLAGGFSYEALVKLPSDWSLNNSDQTNEASQVIVGGNGADNMLLWFQHDQWTTGFAPYATVLSFAGSIGGWAELDMPLDGLAGRPSLSNMLDGNFHHIVATYNTASGVKAIYVDGTQRISASVTPGTEPAFSSGQTILLGGLGAASYNLQGTLDEVALYDGMLSPSDVLAHYHNVQNGLNYYATPEPSTIVLLFIGLIGLLAYAGPKRK